jgi:hypothetical protein
MVELFRQKVLASDSSIEIILEEEEEEEEEEVFFSHFGFTTDEGMTWVKKDIDFWHHAN